LLNEPNGTPPGGTEVNSVFSIAPDPSDYGQSFTLTVMVSPQAVGSPSPTGSAGFSIDGSLVGTILLVGGKASLTVNSTLGVGTHTLIATYNGDGFYSPKSSSSLHVVRPPVYLTQTTLIAAPTTVLASQTVRLTATVSSSPLPPSGIVTFLDGTRTLGSQSLDSNGVALLDTATLISGMHSITAKYQGYTSPTELFASSISSPSTIIVNSNLTTTALSASTSSPTAGTVVTFTANVASGAGVPLGGVTFYDGTVNLGTSSLKADGSASFSTASLSIKTHAITASFNANATFSGSISSVLDVSVVAASASTVPTVISLTVEDNPAGDISTLFAKVSAVSGSPSGTVTFLDGGNILRSMTTDSFGTAILPVGMLSSGVHKLSASFSGSFQFAPSVSPGLYEQWPASGLGFTLRIAPSSMPATEAGSESFRLSITPNAGFDQRVRLSCEDGLPAGYTCVFSPPSLDAGGTSYLLIHYSMGVVASQAGTRPWVGVVPGVLVFLVPLSFLVGTASDRRSHFLMLFLVCFSVLTGCGNPSSSSDRSQMFVASIQASSGTGTATIVHTTQISLNVSVFK
jgi:hypothetical protein